LVSWLLALELLALNAKLRYVEYDPISNRFPVQSYRKTI